jgi:hypothetical protein
MTLTDDTDEATEPRPPAADLLHVDPRKISLVIDSPRLVTKGVTRVADGDWDAPRSFTFEQSVVFRSFEDRFLSARPWQETDFYRRASGQIGDGIHKWECRDVAELDARLENIDRLFETIRRDGYKSQRELVGKSKDEVLVAIRRDGRFMFGNGQHRLSIAKLLRLSSIPVRVVCRHSEWEAFKVDVRRYANEPKRGGKVYQWIDHPDLSDFPAHHGNERMAMIAWALSGRPGNGRELLDIGTHWGTMGRFMESLGYRVTGVESSKSCAKFAAALSVATESAMIVERSSVFDLPGVERFDTILALNIFHHFIKTEELHEQLKGFLQRLNASTIIFEPHRHSPPGQMRNAFRNYAENDFAGFVATHARMKNVQFLGEANDGRPLFLLTR